MTNTMEGWTPKTSLLLRNTHTSKCSHDANGFHDGYGGYDVIDHAFGGSFPSALLQELQSNGWIFDPMSGIGGKLRPARTKMDADVDNVLQSFATSFIASKSGDGDDALVNGGQSGGTTRGDESAFIPRNERMQDSFAKKHALLNRFVKSIESTAFEHLGKCGGDVCDEHSEALLESEEYFEFDSSLTSVQIARYPGDGHAGYPRHCDRGAECMTESMQHEDQINLSQTPKRLLTFVYYLTPADWNPQLDGGALRMFPPKTQQQNKDDGAGCNYFDVMPYPDRLVVFRSDIMEHQVLPSLRRDRIAITVWLYGRHIVSKSENYPRLGMSSLENTTSANRGAGKDSMDSILPPPLPVSAEHQSTRDDRTIFVAIPSYRDRETWPTIKSLVQTARNPERVYIGVVFQVATSSREEVHEFTTAEGSGVSLRSRDWSLDKNFRSIIMDYKHATGPCYARHLCQTLHRGEDYVLQIDAHMRFRPHWDDYLIQQLDKTTSPGKSVLTTYPPGYDRTKEPGSDAETRATILVPWKFGEDGMLRQKGRLIRTDYHSDNDNIPCLLYAGGFNFFHSSLLNICPYDNIHGLFFGEETLMAVRLFTHGFDLYAPPHNVCYHLWERNPFRVNADSKQVKQMREEALEVVRMQLIGKGGGLGTVRSVRQFFEKLGVDFEKQVLEPGCESAGLDDGAFVASTSPDRAEALNNVDMSSVLELVGKVMNST